VLFARTSKGLERMNAAFKNRETKKQYWALVEGKLEDGRDLQHYLKKSSKTNKSTVFKRPEPEAKEALLSFKVLNTGDRYSLVEIDLHTGRHHQIRAQFSAIGHPVKGDVKYGARRGERDKSICLHSRNLTFEHPTTKELVNIIAKTPSTFDPFI